MKNKLIACYWILSCLALSGCNGSKKNLSPTPQPLSTNTPSPTASPVTLFSSNNQGLVYKDNKLLAGSNVFTGIPDYSTIVTVKVDQQSGKIYAGTQACNVYVLNESWTQLNGKTCIVSSQDHTNMASATMAIDSSYNVYAVTTDGKLYKLAAESSSWTELDKISSGIYSIAVDNSDNVYAGSDTGVVYKIANNTARELLNVGTTISSIAVDNNGNVYIGSYNGGVYKIANNKATELVGSTNNQNRVVSSIAVYNSGNVDNVYIGSSIGNVYKIANNTATQLVDSTNQNRVFSSIAVDNSGNVYASSDTGYVYQVIVNKLQPLSNSTIPDKSSVKTITVSNGNFYAVTKGDFPLKGDNVYKLSQSGGSWQSLGDVKGSIDGSKINVLAVDTKGDIYAGTHFGGIWTLPKDGSDWMNLTSFQPTATTSGISDLVLDNNGRIFISTGDLPNYGTAQVYEINGSSWTYTSFDNQIPVSIATNNKGIVYAGTPSGNVYNVFDPTFYYRLDESSIVSSIVTDSSGNIYMGTYGDSKGGKVYKIKISNDSRFLLGGGSSPDRSKVRSIAIGNNGNVYAGTFGPPGKNGSVYEVTDKSWKQLGGGPNPDSPNIPGYGTSVNSIKVDNNGNVFVGTGGGNVYEIVKDDKSYTNLHYGNGAPITSIAIAPQ